MEEKIKRYSINQARKSVSRRRKDCPGSDQVLIGVIRRSLDLQIAIRKHWYRIPAQQKFRSQPHYLAFYLTKSSGSEGGAISYYAPVRKISRVRRKKLLPEESKHPRAEEWYWKFHLGPIRTLPHRIKNRLGRRITFAYTTLPRLRRAGEIGELFELPPLEEVMRKLLNKARIFFIPQFCVMHQKKCRYRLDFALFCRRGKIALECDHSKWHRRPARIAKDRQRDRWLDHHSWTVMRFSEEEILNQPLKTIQRTQKQMGRLGGQGE